MWRAETHVREELGGELGQVRQRSSNNESTNGVANETDLAQAGDWTEREDVLLDLGGQPLTHFHDVAFSLVFITL